jgi:hypothetical protein
MVQDGWDDGMALMSMPMIEWPSSFPSSRSSLSVLGLAWCADYRTIGLSAYRHSQAELG